MEIVETKEHLECHCCTTKDDVYICELDNCDYPLCLTCKEKVLKLENKCPNCRRSVIIDINNSSSSEPDSDSDSDSELEHEEFQNNCREKCCNKYCNKEVITFVSDILQLCLAIIMFIIAITMIFAVIILIGRTITLFFQIGPVDYWCQSLGEHFVGHFIGFGILGALIGFCIVFWCAGILHDCICSDDN